MLFEPNISANMFLLALAIATVPVSLLILEIGRRLSQYRALNKSPQTRDCKDPPCENPYDFFGILKTISATRHLLNKTAIADSTELFRRHGTTYTSTILGAKVLFTCDPQNIKHLLVTRFNDYDASIVRAHLFRPITEHGIFAVDGPQWRVARDMYRNQFSNTRAIFNLQAQEQGFQALLTRIEAAAGKPIDMQPLFLNLTLDLTTAFALGESVDSLSPTTQSDEKKRFVASLLFLKKRMARDGFLGPVHVLLPQSDFHSACADVKRYVEHKCIPKALAKKRDGEKTPPPLTPSEGGGGGYNLLSGLIAENYTDVVRLRDSVITILIAGIDSVAGLLSTTLWLLARHEAVWQRLRAETLALLVDDNIPPTYEQLRNFAYLRNVLNEGNPPLPHPLFQFHTMRTHPPVPFNARVANTDTILPRGGPPSNRSPVLIRKGARVVFSTWATHRSTASFGDDALEFRPERWEEGNNSIKGEAFVPFNSGPRACPGQQYAMLEASYILVRIVQTFETVRNRDERVWVEKMGLNLFNENGVLVEFSGGNMKMGTL
ncbi:MAG: hypothetical protein Q9195_008015 [Heterodermia aff. obscurata]